jgi:DNA-directed RNA polymerase subunit RPC12/RpoP
MLVLNYNKNYAPPSQEVIRLLELSKREVEGMAKRTLKCPICGFRIEGVYADGIGHRDIKCKKCKLEATVNLAYFRRQKRNQNYVRWSKELKALNLRK